MLDILDHNPALYLDELQDHIESMTRTHNTIATIHNDLRRCLPLLKKVALTVHPAQLAQRQAEYICEITQIPPEYLVLTDEAGISKDTHHRKDAWACSTPCDKSQLDPCRLDHTNQCDIWDSMFASLPNHSGFGTDHFDIEIVAVLAEITGPENLAGDNTFEVVNPRGEEEESDEQLTMLLEDVMLDMPEMEIDTLRNQEALQAQVKRLLAYSKAEVNKLEDVAHLGLGDDNDNGGDSVDGDVELAD
ncbi:hypothetical protein MJO28_005404 [Puccinia striiformis f. sp. tritici]|nr:hypothetical protein MJO28_005404 [Puccinia striiformis f. sp. tritici]